MADQEDDYRSSDDEDYVPEGAEEDIEDGSSGDEVDEVTAADGDIVNGRRCGTKKESKKAKKEKVEEASSVDVDAIFAAMLEEDSKMIAQTAGPSEEKPSISSVTNSLAPNETPSSTSEPKTMTIDSGGTKTITEVFDFAGEEVRIQKNVTTEEFDRIEEEKRKAEEKPEKKPSQKRGGLGDVLTMLKKKPKMSVLDKSNHDWDNFKKENDLTEELQTHNRGKNGYLENQEFLIRTDLREFETEKAMRATARRKC